MAGEWTDVRLDDLVLKRNQGVNTTTEKVNYSSAGVVVIRANNISAGRIDFTDVTFVDSETFGRIKDPCKPKQGDVLYTNIGSQFGNAAIVKHTHPFVIAWNVLRLQPNNSIDGRFLTYLLNEPSNKSRVVGLNSSSTMPFVSGKEIGNVRFSLPPLAEQRAIASVLGALDDKIELNRRMNATLEAMARALFQSWFVDFDPVRAKLDGRQPTRMDAATAALFPSTFQDSALGHIPKGWETSTIGKKLQTVLGGTPSRAKAEYWTDGTVAWINSGKTNEFRIIEPSEWITKDALENSSTKLLPRRTTVLAITGATLGQVSITEIECCANQSVIAIPAASQFPTEFIYPWIEENIEKLIASQTGGAQQHINKGNVEELALLCPDSQVVAAYQTKAKPLFDQIAANCFQSRTLAALRDTLLPKLLSGELNVAGAATSVKEAV
jgi:type I restriction enzyme S subunit